MKSIELTLNYKSGARIKQVVNYVHFEENSICFTVKNQVHYTVGEIVKVPLENLSSFDVKETEKQWND